MTRASKILEKLDEKKDLAQEIVDDIDAEVGMGDGGKKLLLKNLKAADKDTVRKALEWWRSLPKHTSADIAHLNNKLEA